MCVCVFVCVCFPLIAYNNLCLCFVFFGRKKNKKASTVGFRKLYSEDILRSGFITNEKVKILALNDFSFVQFSALSYSLEVFYEKDYYFFSACFKAVV